MIRDLTFNDVDKLGEMLDSVTIAAAMQTSRRDATDAVTPGVLPTVSRLSPAGRSIWTGRDLLRSPFPLGWSSH